MLLNIRRWLSNAVRMRQTSHTIRRNKATARPTLEFLEDRLAPATWTGAVDDKWSTAGNWSGGLPVAGAALVFPAGALHVTNTNDLPANRTFSSITFSGTGYTLGGTSAIQLSNGIQSTASGSINAILFNIGLTTRDQTFAVTSSDGQLHLTGAISGAWGITKIGSGTLFYEGNTANTYSDALGTMVNSGTLVLGKNGAQALAGRLVVGAGASVQYGTSGNQIADGASVTIGSFGTLSLNGQSDTIGSLTLTGATVDSGAGILTISGNIATNASDSPSLISGHLNIGSPVRTVSVAQGAALDDLIISAVVSGSGGLNKMGSGKLVLSGSSTYGGATTVSAGIVEVQSSSALGSTGGATTVNAGATLQVAADGLTISEALTLNGNGVSNLGALRFLSSGGDSTWDGNIVLATSSRIGVTSDTVGTLNLDGVISGAGGLTKIGNGSLEIGGSSNNTFTGVTNVNEGTLLLNKGSPAITAVRNLVIGDGVGVDTVQLSGSNQILNTASVTINGLGFLDLNGFDDVIGSLTMTGGSVDTGAGTLTLGGNVVSNAAATSAVIAGKVDLGGVNRNISVADGAASDDLVLSAVISNGSLTKMGTGKLNLSGTNTYTGTTSVTAGTLAINNSSALGTTINGTTVSAGATLTIETTGLTIAEDVTLNGAGVGSAGALRLLAPAGAWSGDVTLASSTSIGVPDGTLSMTTGVIGGAGALSKIGTGNLVLSGTNTYTGATNITAGSVIVKSNAALGSTAAGTTVSAGASLVFDSTDGDISSSEKLTLNGVGASGQGALQGTGDHDVTLTGSILLATTSTINASGAGALNTNGVISGAGGLTKTGDSSLIFGGSGANTYTGTTNVNAGFLTLHKTPGVNAIVAPVIVSDTLEVIANNQIADTVSVTVNGGHFDLNGNSDAIASLTMMGSASVTTGVAGLLTLKGNIVSDATALSATIAGNLDLGGAIRTVTVADGPAADELIISAIISNGGLTKLGLGTLVLSGANTYTRATTVSAGTLAVQNNTALGTSAGATAVAAGATLAVDADGLSIAENVTLNGSGQGGGGALQQTTGTTSTWTGTITLASATTIGNSTGMTLTLSGVISGAASLTKVGAGTIALGATNTYSGPTNINGGNLAANGGGSATGTGIVTVNNSGTLSGHGTVGNVVVKTGGTLAPSTDQNTPATLTTGSVFFNAGSTFLVITKATLSDHLNVLGTVTINGATLNVNQVTAGALNTEYTIIFNDGGDNVLGAFAVFAGDFNPNYSITYNVSGNDVVLKQIV